MRKLTHLLVLTSLFSHVFCCVLPFLASISILSATFGMLALPLTWSAFFHSYEIEIVLVAGGMLLLTGILNWYSEKTDCHDHGCHHGDCTPKKTLAHKLFYISIGLYLINLVIFFVMPHIH